MSDGTQAKADWTDQSVQGARHLFIAQLRSRLNEINPEGVDEFRVAWTAVSLDASGALPLATLDCRISYGSEGSAICNGTDRGRQLGMMDTELTKALNTETQSAAAGGTTIFWSEPRFAPVTTNGDRLERVAIVQIISYQESR